MSTLAPIFAVHADWSVDPRKRWMTAATGCPGAWVVTAPEPVGDPATLCDRLRARAGGAPVALGVDFPLGLPRQYAALHVSEANFSAFLRALRQRPEFFSVAAHIDGVRPGRPFYPLRGVAGMTRAAHAAALGLPDTAALGRACDRATAERPAGAVLFWTLGANQTGKAAIAAWRDVIVPALHGPSPPRLWPFDGPFRSLLAPGSIAIAETYPAEALRQLGLRLVGSKRRQSDRAAIAAGLLAAMVRLRAAPEPSLHHDITSGFGADPAGEDRFDSVLGVLSVLLVLSGQRPDTAPDDPALHRWEGWVLGQVSPPR